jgi:hypothetical protein
LVFSSAKQKLKTMKESLLLPVENSGTYTLTVAEAMPEKLAGFKPAVHTWSFRERLHHIAYGIEWRKDNYVKGVKIAWEPPATSKSRKEVVAYPGKAYDSLKDAVNNTIRSGDLLKGFFATPDHITHHRGS